MNYTIKKICSTCRKEKDLSDYYKTKLCVFFGDCKTCHYSKAKRWREKNKERVKNNVMQWKRANATRLGAKQAEYYQGWKARNRATNLTLYFLAAASEL